MSRATLKVIGTSVTLTEQLRRQAARDLPFRIEFEVLDGLACQRRGIMSPATVRHEVWFCGFGGVRVDEVTRDAHPPEEVSGR